MRLRLIILSLSFISFTWSQERSPVVIISLGGVSTRDIHDVVKDCAADLGYNLTKNYWIQGNADKSAGDGDAYRIKMRIDALAIRNSNDKSNLSLIVVGKSAGGVLAWNTFKRHYGAIDDFHRVVLVMVDPHGSVDNDGKFGPYHKYQDLWWLHPWSSNTNFFRIYNIYQYEGGPLTGASFPDKRVYRNIRIPGNDIDHMNITKHQRTRELIKEALTFAWFGR